jgi:hypothetical protein
MSVFIELDPNVARAAIEGYEDVLSAEARELDRLYATFKCPRGCGRLQREIDARHTFSDENYLTGRALLRCKNCSFLIDPHTRIVLESGNASKIPVESSPIIQPGRDMVGEIPNLEAKKEG